MRTAIWGEHVVCEWTHRFREGIIILNCNLDTAILYLFFNIEDIIGDYFLALVQAANVALDTAFEVEGVGLARALIVNRGEDTLR